MLFFWLRPLPVFSTPLSPMPLYFVCLVWLLTWSGVNPVSSCLNKSFGLPFIRVCLICKPRVTEYFANMQTADIKEIISAVSNQGAILNQHNQLFESLTHSVGSLTQQQSEQQQQLVSIANSLKEITSQLQSMNAGGSRETNPSPVVSLPTPTSVFPVSKPDKFARPVSLFFAALFDFCEFTGSSFRCLA